MTTGQLAAYFSSDETIGWLTPTGNVNLVWRAERGQYFRFYGENIDQSDLDSYRALEGSAAYGWEGDINAGDHPAWRTFENNWIDRDSEAMEQFMSSALEAGWGRVGTFDGDKLELYCSTANEDVLRKAACKIARQVDRACVVTIERPIELASSPGKGP